MGIDQDLQCSSPVGAERFSKGAALVVPKDEEKHVGRLPLRGVFGNLDSYNRL
jgi:hypothetical protein